MYILHPVTFLLIFYFTRSCLTKFVTHKMFRQIFFDHFTRVDTIQLFLFKIFELNFIKMLVKFTILMYTTLHNRS